MDEDHYSPSEINSVDVKDVVHASIVYINKKRKLHAEQLGMPLPKHKSWDHRGLALEVGSPSNEIHEKKEDFCVVLLKRKLYEDEEVGESEVDSGNGSNSFAEDGDVENYSSHHDTFASLNYEQFLEYESNLHFGYEDHNIEQCSDKGLQDLLYASSGNPNNFVLSSGRWDVNSQEPQKVTEKLTIDKEFEQYFSTLML